MIYLDNSATTKPSETALRAMHEAEEAWGNPSSVYTLGLDSKKLLDECRRKVGKTLGIQKYSRDMLCFTASGTEANNIALLGCYEAKVHLAKGKRGTVLISAGEHPSIDEPAKRLEENGYILERIGTRGGELDMEGLTAALERAKDSENPVIFAGFMLVNNETGALYNVKDAAKAVKAYFPDANVHCDCVQGYLKVRTTPAILGVDTMSVSAHKIHSVRGAGALYISANVLKRHNIAPVMPGGGQENGLRSGTENLCAIAAFAAAAEEANEQFGIRGEKTRHLRERLESEFTEKLEPLGVTVNRPKTGIYGIMNISLPGIRSETMLNYLSERGIYVSAGSACAANSKKKSAALEAFGCSEDEMDCAIRISFDYTNTEDEIAEACTAIAAGIGTLQRKKK
jgi:cysteine desulfurase